MTCESPHLSLNQVHICGAVAQMMLNLRLMLLLLFPLCRESDGGGWTLVGRQTKEHGIPRGWSNRMTPTLDHHEYLLDPNGLSKSEGNPSSRDLLEDADGLLRLPSRYGGLLPSASADVRSADGVIAF